MTLAPTLVTPRRFLTPVSSWPRRINGLASARAFSAIAGLLAFGVLLAMLTTPDPLWWHLHFSHLGTFPVLSGAIFNATIMASGALITVLSRRVFVELRRHVQRSRSNRHSPIVLSTLVASVGVHLTGVGLVPIDTLTALHEGLAFGIPLSVAAMMITAPALLRGTGRPLGKRTIPAATALVGAYLVMSTGFINLAAFELIGFTAMFAWMTMFLGCLVPRSAASAPASHSAVSSDVRGDDAPRTGALTARRAAVTLAHAAVPLGISRGFEGCAGMTRPHFGASPHRAITLSTTAARLPRGGPRVTNGPASVTSARASDITRTRTRTLSPPVRRQTASSSGRLSRSPVCSSPACS